MKVSDTIAAIATAQGEAGIGIVRLSGPKAIAIADSVWLSTDGKRLRDRVGYKMSYGRIIDRAGEEIDEALASVMKAPKSYTREDVVEINCHGGPAPLRRALEAVLEAGARLAEPGEFTKRAFINGRIDLAQAEAVIDTIRARTDKAARLAVRQLEGGLSETVTSISRALLDTRACLEAAVDFSDEDIEPPLRGKLRKDAEKCAERIAKLIATAHDGEILRNGVRLVIVGRPNVGKSSLLNALLKRDRAIVTSVPGTTRDIIEETVSINGVPFVVADTAGIRDETDEVEAIGVALSHKSLAAADLILVVVDASQGALPEDHTILKGTSGKPTIVAVNKNDLASAKHVEATAKSVSAPGRIVVRVSAATGEGVERLEAAFGEAVFSGRVLSTDDILVSNARHADALRRALTSVRRAVSEIREGLSEEFASAEIRDALAALGEITGTSVDDEVLNRIFAEFCIGK
ncbi:MAG: tRNA uridine-5-carboxymethylaminomethyl(34) synthesis GTPase MnmE [Actinomycetota bacterium]